LIVELPDAVLQGDASVEIEHIEYDSRLVRPGTLFVAIHGFTQDGYDYVADALSRGAVAVMGQRPGYSIAGLNSYVCVANDRSALSAVAARFYGHPGLKIKAIGVTGTNGKTTTCFLLKKILEARQKKTGLITTVQYDTGSEVFSADRTTPEALEVQRLLYLMKRNYCVNAVVEVSSHALTLHRVDNINFRVAVYTSFSRDHLDFHGTMENYLAAKKQLIQKVSGELSYVVINLDVPEYRSFFGDIESSFMTYSIDDENADVRCGNYEFNPDRTVFDLITPMGVHTVTIHLPGRFNLSNALAAAAGGLAAGVDIENVVRGLESARPVPGRLNIVSVGQPFSIYVDYAHTPDAIERLCESVRKLATGRLLLLFGCGGDRDKGKRPLMGAIATTCADFAVVTSDNPRSEDPKAIIEDIRPGLKGSHFEIIPDRHFAIASILKMANPGDVVLITGKGHESYMEVKGEKLPFSDIDEATAALAQMGFAETAGGVR
jgi:UDP-N-acetylmuramoyl-L-alanyl-D-glutamate--2,6-diaminopimelate ligase